MEYSRVIDCWFNHSRHHWFVPNDEFDIFLTTRYKDLLLEQLTCNDNDSKDDNKIILGKILLCNQFSRHIFKNDPDMIKQFDKISLRLLTSTDILQNIDIFTTDAQYFLILPLIKESNHPIYKRFYEMQSIAKCNKHNIQYNR